MNFDGDGSGSSEVADEKKRSVLGSRIDEVHVGLV